ncbi:MAG TPA: hypothetical protein PKN96_04805 [Flavobacterium sp.]|uniref:hypothetical protein n=1 Tax=Flavobacterium sp. TaxID=239 RepID=UPI002B8325BC|nr:hypothetical protein [Flavobacterium sp.]HNP32589.1 hypothetical protein [Flavobacterium sp.]
MNIYDCTGTFDGVNKLFSFNVQLTDILPDTFKITAYYDICTSNRFAIVAILQTMNGNSNDLSNYPKNYIFPVNNINFSALNKSYVKGGDKDINTVKAGDTIYVVVHHGIGFDPITNHEDDMYIKNYKAGTYIHYAKGAPPGVKGGGILY